MKVIKTVVITPEERTTLLNAIDYMRIIANKADIFDDEIGRNFEHMNEFNDFLDGIRCKVIHMSAS